MCDTHWRGARCNQSDADVQSLFMISSTAGIRVMNPFARYVQEVPLIDNNLRQAIKSTSQRSTPAQVFRAFDGQLATFANDSLYIINPFTGTSFTPQLGHNTGTGVVALAYTSNDKTLYYS